MADTSQHSEYLTDSCGSSPSTCSDEGNVNSTSSDDFVSIPETDEPETHDPNDLSQLHEIDFFTDSENIAMDVVEIASEFHEQDTPPDFEPTLVSRTETVFNDETVIIEELYVSTLRIEIAPFREIFYDGATTTFCTELFVPETMKYVTIEVDPSDLSDDELENESLVSDQ